MIVIKNVIDEQQIKILHKHIWSNTDTGHSYIEVDSAMGKFTEYELVNCFHSEFTLDSTLNNIVNQTLNHKCLITQGFYCLHLDKDDYVNNWYLPFEAKYKLYVFTTNDIVLKVNDTIQSYDVGDCIIFDETEIVKLNTTSDKQVIAITELCKAEYEKCNEI